MQVGQNAYEADVLTAIKTNQREIFYDIVGIKPIKIETSGKAHVESEDSRSRLPKGSGEASGGTVTKTQSHDASRLPEASEQSIAQASGESNANEAAVLKKDDFEKADRAGFECSAKPPYAVEKFCAIFIVFFALFWWYNRGRI